MNTCQWKPVFAHILCSDKASVKDLIQFYNPKEQVDLLIDKGWRKKITEEEKLTSENKEIILMLLDITRALANQD